MYAVRRPVENVYLVRERDRRRTRELVALSLALVPPMAVLFAAIWANLETVRLGYQLERLQVQLETLTKRNQVLQSEKAQASGLARVETIARGTLGLVPPKPEQVIQVRDGALNRALPAAPAPAPEPVPTPDLIGPPAPALTEEGF